MSATSIKKQAGLQLRALLFVVLSSCSYLQPDPSLADTVAELNKKCPAMIDSETRLDRIALEQEQTLSYYHTLVNVEGARVDTHQFRLALTPGLLSNIRVTEAMRPLREQHVTFRYHYADRASRPILTLQFTPDHYR